MQQHQNEEKSKYRICNNTFICSPEGFENKNYVSQRSKYLSTLP